VICGIQADRQRTFAKIRLWKHCFPAFHNFLSTGAKVPQDRKLKGTKVVCGAKVPGVRKFHGTKVLGLFAPRAEERKGQIPSKKHSRDVILFVNKNNHFSGAS